MTTTTNPTARLNVVLARIDKLDEAAATPANRRKLAELHAERKALIAQRDADQTPEQQHADALAARKATAVDRAKAGMRRDGARALRHVVALQVKLDELTARRDEALAIALDAGVSARQLASSTGLSHPTVAERARRYGRS